MGRGGWSRRGEYKRGNVHQDDRCRTEIDGEAEPARCRDSAQQEGECAHRQIAQEIEGREHPATMMHGRRRTDHLQAADE